MSMMLLYPVNQVDSKDCPLHPPMSGADTIKWPVSVSLSGVWRHGLCPLGISSWDLCWQRELAVTLCPCSVGIQKSSVPCSFGNFSTCEWHVGASLLSSAAPGSIWHHHLMLAPYLEHPSPTAQLTPNWGVLSSSKCPCPSSQWLFRTPPPRWSQVQCKFKPHQGVPHAHRTAQLERAERCWHKYEQLELTHVSRRNVKSMGIVESSLSLS